MEKDIEQKFKGWLYWVARLGYYGKINGLGVRLWNEDVKLCPKSWRAYFDEGMRPMEAIKEDLKYA